MKKPSNAKAFYKLAVNFYPNQQCRKKQKRESYWR